jgi:hypothetical protein
MRKPVLIGERNTNLCTAAVSVGCDLHWSFLFKRDVGEVARLFTK